MYDDLKDLYNKVLPPLSKFEDKMYDMTKEHEQAKEIIRGYDEVLAEKASKTSIREVYQYVKKYATSNAINDHKTEHN
jgi:hemerythrin-like domain-containing protein